jgi:UDP-N-acetyl-D-glucosamine dehydrogenase
MALYKKAIDHIYPVSSPRVAEMVKILENTYRLINISLINELALLAGKMDINIWEVIEAAKTKPFGFQAFYPVPESVDTAYRSTRFTSSTLPNATTSTSP